ncbi:MAG: STAS-like domain-containing protein [Longimicrobiales bacterium]
MSIATDSRIAEISVSDHVEVCSSRERGRTFYNTLREQLGRTGMAATLIVSFAGVRYVSPSFLDETVVKLVAEHPELRGHVAVRGLSELARANLRTILAAREVDGLTVLA